MAKFITNWHRFNTVDSGPSQTSPDNLSNLVGSGTGTARLNYTDAIELHDPTVSNSDGDTSTFSSLLHPDAIITGIQYQVFAKHSVGTGTNSILYHFPKIGSTEIILSSEGASFITPVDVGTGGALVKFKSSIVNEDLGLGSTLSLSNVDDIKFKVKFTTQIGASTNFRIAGKDFEDSDGPSPAVRLEYEIRPKVTVTTGKLSITSGKTHIF